MNSKSALRERDALIHELRQIVQAMKNLAFAELQRASRILDAQSLARDVVIEALKGLPNERSPAICVSNAHVPITWFVLGAERGFCGAFNARLSAALADLRSVDPQVRLLLASHRLYESSAVDHASTAVVAGCASIDEADTTVEAWLAMLAEEAGRSREVWFLYAGEKGLERLRLLPEPELQSVEAAPPTAATTPMHYLPLPVLRGALVRQVVRIMLQGGLYSSLKQENHWRLSQMQHAQDHLDKLGRTLQRRYAGLRQSDITNELETLMSAIQGSVAFGGSSPLTAANQ